MSISHYDCVFVALSFQHAIRKSRIVACGLSDSIKKNERKICLLIFSTTFV